jgi:hypothetical protein
MSNVGFPNISANAAVAIFTVNVFGGIRKHLYKSGSER